MGPWVLLPVQFSDRPAASWAGGPMNPATSSTLRSGLGVKIDKPKRLKPFRLSDLSFLVHVWVSIQFGIFLSTIQAEPVKRDSTSSMVS